MSAGSLGHGELGGRVGSHRGWRWSWRPVGLSATAVGVGGLTALAAGLRFYGLGRQGLWFDEANTALLMRFSPGKMLGLIPQSESTPPLYYCAAWVWTRVFGDGQAGLRSLSALAGVLLVPVAYGAAAELVSRRAGIICAALAACNPLLIWYSQEARSYQALALLTGLALLTFARARRHPSAGAVTLWAGCCALALATHYFAAVAVVPEAAWLAVVHRRRRAVRIGVAVVAACGAALIPLALSQNGTGHDAWIGHAPLGARLAQIVPQLLIGTGAPARAELKLAAIALAALALVLLAVGGSASERRGARRAGGLAVAGLGLALALIGVGFDDVLTRNLIELWLPAAVVVSAGLAAARTRRVGALAATALCAIGLAAAVGVAVDRTLQRPDWPGVARALGAEPPRGESRAILIQHYATVLPLSLYLPGLRVLRAPARIGQLDVISMRAPSQPLCWWGAECNLIPSRMQPAYPIPGLRAGGERRVLQFTIALLNARRPVRLTRSMVAHALTTTTLRRDELLVQRT